MKLNDDAVIGVRFNRLTVLDRCKDGSTYKNGKWLFKCDCGNTTIVSLSKARSGVTKSCGCFRKEVKFTGINAIPGTLLYTIERSARHRKIAFNLTPEEMWKQYTKQQGKCYYTGMLLTFRTSRLNGTASLDRIDSSKGYIPSNVQWVHKTVNIMKTTLSDQEFIDMCTLVSHHKNKGNI